MVEVKYDPILGCVGWVFKKPIIAKIFTKKTSKKRKKR